MPSGTKEKVEYNKYDAFVTYFHEASKYSGPGTDGTVTIDMVVTMEPPQKDV